MRNNSVAENAGRIFIRLAVVASQKCEVAQNSEKIRTYSSSRSTKVIDLGTTLVPIKSAYATSYYSLTVTLVVSRTAFEISMHKARNQLVFSTPPLFDALVQGEPVRILDETYITKTRGTGLLCGESCMILTSNVFDWSTRVTHRRTDRRTDDSI